MYLLIKLFIFFLFGGKKIVPKKTASGGGIAVLIVDMQWWYVSSVEKKFRRMFIKRHLQLLETCARRGIPVIMIKAVPVCPRPKFCYEIIQVLLNRSRKVPVNRVVEKEYNDGFFKTDLDKILKSLDVNKLFVTGVNAGFCVLDTVKSALNNGYLVCTAEEYLGNHKDDDSERPKVFCWYSKNTLHVSGPVSPSRVLKLLANADR